MTLQPRFQDADLAGRRFDGHGMVHCVRIKDGSAAYCNRYVETSVLAQEQKAGRPLLGKVRRLFQDLQLNIVAGADCWVLLQFGDAVGLSGLVNILLDRFQEPLGIIDKVCRGAVAGCTLGQHSLIHLQLSAAVAALAGCSCSSCAAEALPVHRRMARAWPTQP